MKLLSLKNIIEIIINKTIYFKFVARGAGGAAALRNVAT